MADAEFNPGRAQLAAAPLVSIVVPFLNAAAFLETAVQSVRAQTLSSWELILVDDGSTDSGPMIARRLAEGDGRIRCLQHPGGGNRGISASRNLGVDASRGEYVAFLDADDAWLDEKLESQVDLLRRRPELDLVFGPSWVWDGSTTKTLQPMTLPGGLLARGAWIAWMMRSPENAPAPSAVLMRRRAAVALRGADGRFSLYEDQVMWCKASIACTVYNQRVPLTLYRIHAASVCASASPKSQAREQLRYCAWVINFLGHRGPLTLMLVTAGRLVDSAIRFDPRLLKRALAMPAGRKLGLLPRAAWRCASLFPATTRTVCRAVVRLVFLTWRPSSK